MFTGLVETTGVVAEAAGDSPRRLTLESDIATDSVLIGASICIDGCCLTVVEKGARTLTFEAATETLARTTIGRLATGDIVNLEQSVTPQTRLGGHYVMGHVDGVGKVVSADQRGSALYVGVEVPEELARYIAPRGSITISGVSLTVTGVEGRRFYVGLIPHTLEVTAPGPWKVGNEVNLEVDVIARYLERLIQSGVSPGSTALTEVFLKDSGFA
ncbi:MAG: riboflavin synthase [Myxococcota bacterium]